MQGDAWSSPVLQGKRWKIERACIGVDEVSGFSWTRCKNRDWKEDWNWETILVAEGIRGEKRRIIGEPIARI